MLTAFFSPGFAAPIGPHLMPIQKFGLIAQALAHWEDVRLREPEPVEERDLLRVHTPEYVEAIRTGEPRALAQSQKFPWSPELFGSVCLTNGGCVAAARQALKDGVSAAVASGFHHAHADHGEGFCTFNGLVVALEALAAAGEIQTGAVLDMDLHYGNGTASLLATRPRFRALSIYGNDYIHNKAYVDVRTRQHEDGPNHRSIPLPTACTGATLQGILAEALPLLLEPAKPDILFYQAGADPYREDPFSPLALGVDDLFERDRAVFAFARDHGIPVAWVLAGGYTRQIEKIVQIHLNTFRAWREVWCPAGVTG